MTTEATMVIEFPRETSLGALMQQLDEAVGFDSDRPVTHVHQITIRNKAAEPGDREVYALIMAGPKNEATVLLNYLARALDRLQEEARERAGATS